MESKPGYVVGKVGSKWAIFYRLDERTSFDQRVRYATKREAVGICSLMNREAEREAEATREEWNR